MSAKDKEQIVIQWANWDKLINKAFVPLVDNTDRYLIMYGGRGSGKSDFAAKKLIYRCLTEKYFRCVLIRNVYQTIKDSSFQTIKDIVTELGLDELFEFKISPLEIICTHNGNKFIARGLDDALKLKSLKDPSAIWWEEDIPDQNSFITISTSVRTKKATYLQEIFTINPEVEGHYEDHYFYKQFFGSNAGEKSFRSAFSPDETKDQMFYTVHHSTYKDNRWLPANYKDSLEKLKITHPYYYTIYTEGNWGNKTNEAGFYKLFSRGKNTGSVKYNPDLALHISFDFNVNPYMSASIWQVSGKTAWCIDEVTTTTPNNTSKGVCQEIIRKYNHHEAGVFIYGDPSGKHADTRSEQGVNDYRILQNELRQFHPSLRVAPKAPAVATRGKWINTIFFEGFDEIEVIIGDNCLNLINDLIFTKEASDGTKHKERGTKDGVSYEKYGHLSDTLDYFLTECFKNEYKKYNRGGKVAVVTFGTHQFNPKHRF